MTILHQLNQKSQELQTILAQRDGLKIAIGGDPIDRVNDVMSREQASENLTRARKSLAEVHAAIERYAAGEYGVCCGCDGEIAEKRLAALPWAAECRSCAEKAEREGGVGA